MSDELGNVRDKVNDLMDMLTTTKEDAGDTINDSDEAVKAAEELKSIINGIVEATKKTKHDAEHTVEKIGELIDAVDDIKFAVSSAEDAESAIQRPELKGYTTIVDLLDHVSAMHALMAKAVIEHNTYPAGDPVSAGQLHTLNLVLNSISNMLTIAVKTCPLKSANFQFMGMPMTKIEG